MNRPHKPEAPAKDLRWRLRLVWLIRARSYRLEASYESPSPLYAGARGWGEGAAVLTSSCMSSFVRTSLAWVRRVLVWCLSVQERLGDFVLLVGAAVILIASVILWTSSDSQSLSDSQS